MNIVVIGGTGLIGSRVLRHLTELGHQVVAASPSTGSTRSPVSVWTAHSTARRW